MIIRRFDFDIAGIILDIKNSLFDKVYRKQETWLLFRQEKDMLNVSEINAFVKDFLDLCDGKTPLQEISDELYKRYGNEMQEKAFFDSCIKAVKSLGELGLLQG